MKKFPKAMFLVLAMKVASASADATLWQKISGEHERQQLQSAAAMDEGQESHLSQAIHTLTSEVAGELEEDEDYDEGVEYGNMSPLAEKRDETLDLPTVGSRRCTNLGRAACRSSSRCMWNASDSKCQRSRPATRRPTVRPKTNKPTKRPTPKTSRPSRRPTRRPTGTKRPTRRPTRKPTRKPTTTERSASSKRSKSSKNSKSSKSSSRCVDDYEPKSTRGRREYTFALEKSDAACVDKKKNFYTYGEFHDVEEFSDCAEKCVRNVRSKARNNFRGYEWDCMYHDCRCLYDRGTLSSNDRRRYDRNNSSGRGKGPIRGTKKDEGVYCAKLESVEFLGMGNVYGDTEEKVEAEVSRALMGDV